MKKKYSLRFRGVEKHLYRKYGFLRGSDYGVYDAQQALVELQKNLREGTLLTVTVKDLEASQTYHFESILIDPMEAEFNLLDELQRQLLEAGEAIDGAKIYTEINRQFNTEAEVAQPSPERTVHKTPAPPQKKNILQKMFPYLFKTKSVVQEQQIYNQPIFSPREEAVIDDPAPRVTKATAVSEKALIYDYELVVVKNNGEEIRCEFQSGNPNESRNTALKTYFPIEGKYLVVDTEKILVTEIKACRLEKVEAFDIFSLPEYADADDLEAAETLNSLTELPE